MSDAWFAEKMAPDGSIEDGCHPQEAQALQRYSHQNTSVQEAAHAITHPITIAADPMVDVPCLWSLLIDAPVELPASHMPVLIKLLNAIQSLPKPELTGRRTESAPTDGFLWHKLPGFGHQWADEHERDDWRSILARSDPAQRSNLRGLHVKEARIEAQMVSAAIDAIPLHPGYDCICDALECSDAVLDFEVPVPAA